MSKVLRKKITVKSTCSLSLYGGAFGPIRSPFYETLPNIARLIGDGIEVYEETPNGPVRLTMSNFDKFDDEESRIAKEQEAARIKAEEDKKEREAAEKERQAKIAEQRAKEEQRKQQQQQNNQKQHGGQKPNNHKQGKPQVEEVVEE